jgi:hypothetical protein
MNGGAPATGVANLANTRIAPYGPARTGITWHAIPLANGHYFVGMPNLQSTKEGGWSWGNGRASSSGVFDTTNTVIGDSAEALGRTNCSIAGRPGGGLFARPR